MMAILYEDNHLLALDKPAGVLSQGDSTGDRSAVDLARDDLRIRYAKPGNVFVGLVHRLDRPVSGVLLLAKTSKAAQRLSAQFHDRQVEKVYLAVVEGLLPDAEGRWVEHLVKEKSRNRVTVVNSQEDGQEAGLDYRVLRRSSRTTLVELRPVTGRGHQLRVQLASRGFPIFGDQKYGAKNRLPALDGGFRIALHASRLSVTHPTRPEKIVLESPLPGDWPVSERSV